MSDITLRLVKGSPLTNQEVDDNFANLNTDKYQAGDSASFQDVTVGGSLSVTGAITALGYNSGNWNTAYGWGNHANAGYSTTDTTYSVGDGGLTEKNFTTALKTKLDGIATNANNYVLPFTNNSTNWNTAYGWGDHSTQNYATQTYVNNAVSNLVDSAPATLDTLNELAAALGDDPNFAATVTNSIGTKWTQDNTKISNWDTAYAWGNHASAGYLTSLPSHNHDGRYVYSDYINSGYDWNTFSYGSNEGVITRVESSAANPPATGVYNWSLYQQGDSVRGSQIAVSAYAGGNRMYLRTSNGGSGWNGWDRMFGDNYHPNADKWTTARTNTVTLTGDASGSGSASVDGTGNWTVSVPVVVNNDSHTHDGRYVNVTGDTMTGPLVINGNGSYVGSYGYNTLVLQDQSEYPGINFSHSAGNRDWLQRMNGSNASMDWVYRDGGNHSEKMVLNTSGSLTLNGNTVWNAGNDGSGSGLDADLLDGQHGSYYAPSSHNHSLTLSGDVSGSGSVSGTISVSVNDDSHSHSQVHIPDTRGAARAPSYYPDRNVSFDFQYTTDTGAGGESWHVLQTIAPWSTYHSSHRQQQLVFTGVGVKYRYATSDNAWAGWQTMWTSGNDGSGSGLDADLLDGYEGSRYTAVRNTDAVAGDWNSIFSTGNGYTTGFYQVENIGAASHTNAPTGVYTYGGVLGFRHKNSTLKLYASHIGDLVFQTGWSNDAYSGWRRILNTGYYGDAWTSGNDGSGSGLDADLLDGQHGSYYAPASSIGNGTVTITTSGSASGGGTFTLNQSGNTTINISATDTNSTYNFSGSAFVSRNTGNPVAIDSATTNMSGYVNSSSAAGYSDGGAWVAAYSSSWVAQIFQNFRNGEITTRGKNNGTWQSWRKQWDSFNDGSGSGLDADLLDGHHASSTRNSANTIPVRDGNGYINLGWINTTSGNTTSTLTDIYVNTNDNYIRKATPAHFRSQVTDGVYLPISGKAADSDLLDGVDITRVVHGNGVNRTDGGDPNTLRPSGFYENYQGNSPTSTWYNYINMRHTNAGNGHGHQIAGSFYSAGEIYNRSYSGNGTFTGWAKLWNTANDGSGSGLDADLLDGNHASAFLSSANDSEQTANFGLVYWNQGAAKINSDPRINESGYDSDSVNVHWWTTTAAGANYGRVGHALYNGSAYQYLHTKTSQAHLYHNNNKIWTSGNDGSGTGLDADLLDGLHASSFNRKDTNTQYLRPYYAYTNYLTTQNANTLSNQMGGDGGIRVDFINGQSFGTWGHCLTWSGYHAYNMYQLAGYYHVNGASDLFFRSEKDHTNDEWTAWNKIYHTSNDGSGSGLDADLLDGVQGSGYARTDAQSNISMNSYDITAVNTIAVDESIRLAREGFITFYGDNSSQHGIGSRNEAGSSSDDIRINSYSGIHLNLDSNNNNSSSSGLIVGRHGSGTNSMQKFIEVSGETCWTRFFDTSSSTGFTYISFQNAGGTTTYGSIYRSYGNIVYATSSDYRLKENVVDLTNATARINSIPVRRFNFLEHPDRTVDGFIAHEVAAVVPEAVIGEKDEVDADGNAVYQGIDQSKLVPLLTAALQEALTKIEQLETRVNALENGE